MQLLTGPAGSGKTTFILDRFRDALRANNRAIRLLVPTATLAQHLQNRMAREGFVFSPRLIQTFSSFVETWAAGLQPIPDAVLYLIVEGAARRVARPEFARVVHMPGFCASVARTISEFASAGCDSARLATHLPDAPLSAAFLAVYQEVDRELQRRALALRARRLQHAATRIAAEGLGPIADIWLDGFHELPDPELDVIKALGRHANVTLTFDAADSRLTAAGFREQRLAKSRPSPAMLLVPAPSLEREAEEIARRILQQADAGRPFREIGIIVRAQQTYAPILQSTLERFGIPARFYFDDPLDRHAVTRFLSGAVDAMLGGWDHAQTLAVLRLAPHLADSAAMDRFEFAVREQIPNSGIGALQALAGDPAERLHKLIDSLAAIEEWRSFVMLPKEWATRLRDLRALFHADIGDASWSVRPQLRSQAKVLNLFDEALDEAAQALDPAHPLPLPDFWRAAKSVLRLNPLRLNDARRNVVHVLSAHEARQWVLPIVFVCGMVEKQFPQFHRQDPFFPDAARCELNSAGIRVRTAAEFEREERALFESALTRATMLVTLSYPEFDSRGERNLPSIYLEDLLPVKQGTQPVRPQPRTTPAPPLPVEIRTPALLDYLRQKTARVSPTALESYMQCAFQYFGGRTLRLKPAPSLPEERLDFLTQGTIVHEILATWWSTPQDIELLFESVFERYLDEKRIPSGYHTERLRYAMLEDLRAFTLHDHWPRQDFRSRVEEKFLLPLAEGLDISGKIDRIDLAADGTAYIIDYKYSAAQRTKERLKNPDLLQAPLYVMAAERVFGLKPKGMFYVGVKKELVYAGWSNSPIADLKPEPIPENWLEGARERTLHAIEQIRAGRVEPAPSNRDNCRFCDYRDVCRIAAREIVELAEQA